MSVSFTDVGRIRADHLFSAAQNPNPSEVIVEPKACRFDRETGQLACSLCLREDPTMAHPLPADCILVESNRITEKPHAT